MPSIASRSAALLAGAPASAAAADTPVLPGRYNTITDVPGTASSGGNPAPLLVNGLLALVAVVGLIGALLIRRRPAVKG